MRSPDAARALEFLQCADIEILGLLPYASNATLLAQLRNGGDEALAVYKPRRGERPLWDFPSGTLCLREQAAWVVSRELGWDIVPPTVLRDGPAGFGALQLWIEEDEDADVRALVRTHPDELRRIALFDVIVNNTDRKAGHLIVDADGKLWGVDHGICFSVDPKLRTVIWVFSSESVPPELLADLEAFAHKDCGASALGTLLSPAEHDALRRRVDSVIAHGRFPSPHPDRYHVPWPPW
jgi:uncharacterized repeat protein (TIGR03843 family)